MNDRSDVPAHTEKRTLVFSVYWPPHEPRRASRRFREARHHLIDVLGVGCWLGGATKEDLARGLPSHHRCYGATQLEAHHDLVEWAFFNGIDWTKVAKDFPTLGITSDEDFRAAAESEGGLLILCDKHHRLKGHGIHMVDYPSWRPERWAKDNVDFLP